jgi:hypothetical protein
MLLKNSNDTIGNEQITRGKPIHKIEMDIALRAGLERLRKGQ